MADPTVKVGVFADASQLKRELDKAQGQIASFGDSAKKSGALLRDALFGTAVLYGAKRLIDAGNEVVKINAETERVLRTTGAAAWTSKDQISAMADSLSKLTGVDDEAIQSGQNLLLTFTQVKNQVGQGNDVFDRGAKAALDMSTALGTDMRSSVLQLGKALNDPISGMTALRRAGVSFTEDQKKLITELTKSGDLLGAQKVILAEVEKEFGGAAAAAKTPMDELRVSLGNLEESVGGALLPTFNALAGIITTLADAFSALPQPLQTAVLGLGAAAYLGPKVIGAVGGMVGAVKQLPAAFDRAALKAYDAAGAVDNFGAKYGGVMNAAAAGGIVIAAAVASWQIWEAAIHSTDEQIKQIVDNQNELAQSGSYDQVKDRIAAIGSEIDNLTTTINNSSAPWDADYRAQLDEGRDALDGAREAMVRMTTTADDLAAATGTTSDVTFKWLQQQQAAGITYADSATALSAYTGKIDESAMSAEDAALANEGWAQSIKDAADATRAAVDPFFAASDAVDKLQKAQVDAFIASLQFGEGSAEAQAAAEKVARAALDTDSAFSALAAQMAANGQTTDEMKASFQRWVDQGWITQDQANLLITKFGDLTAKAEDYTGNYGATATLDATQAFLTLGDLQYKLTTLDGRVVTATAQINARTSIYNNDGTYNLDNNPATGGGRAFGGPVKAGVVYPVGERGKEFFRPAMDGYVMNGSTLETSSVSASPQFVFNGPINLPNVTNPDEFVDALQRWVKVNGPLPVPVA